jgi:hypothetical protein
VLLRQGLTAWRAAADSPAAPAVTPHLVDDRDTAIVRILVSMVLATPRTALAGGPGGAPMISVVDAKVTAGHLRRDAYL